MKNSLLCIVCIILLAGINGCSSKAPTMAHTHIGHAITGWHDTPAKEGLFTVATHKAKEAVRYGNATVTAGKSLEEIQKDIELVIQATDPQRNETTKVQSPYGLRQALTGSVDHITFAATSADASQNVKDFAAQLDKNARGTLERCELIVALSDEILASTSKEEAVILATEVQSLARANLNGVDADGDGKIGTHPDELGLKQLHTQLFAMIEREDPTYAVVDTWYLFNIVRLPNGTWEYQSTWEEEEGDDGGSGGGGGGGGSY